MLARSRICTIVFHRLRHLFRVCAATLVFSAALAASAWAVDVPFKIDDGHQIIEGAGKLENGHLTGQANRGGQPITLDGHLQGKHLTIEVDGALVSPVLASTRRAGISKYCTSNGETWASEGKVTIPLNVSCGAEAFSETIYLELP